MNAPFKQQFTRGYDLIVGVPLVLWFANAIREVRLQLVESCLAFFLGRADPATALQFFALAATVCFNALLIYLVTVRSLPVRKANGLWPRIAGFLGTFLSVGIVHLRVTQISLSWQILSNSLIFGGEVASVIVLWHLGRAFSIMPEARVLVTRGPYAKVRHPLYVAETFVVAGIAIQFAQPWATLLALGTIGFQVARSFFEEQVLARAFPEYEAYRQRSWRFIPGLL